MSDCFCDYDRPSFYKAEVRVSRKRHRCYECAGAILPTDKYEYTFSIFEGKPYVARTCSRCLALRDYVTAHVPCFCWAHGHMIEDAIETADEYAHEAPGLLFGTYRRQVLINRGPSFLEPRK